MHFMYSICGGSFMEGIPMLVSRLEAAQQTCAVVHHILRETGAFMPLACTGCGRQNVQIEEEVLDAVHATP
jgi:hypothetical protein